MTESSEDEGITILDDEGRLFGLVNVVDLLVILLVLAVVAAGATLLLSDSGQADARHVTMDLGEQPAFIAEQITAGDSFEPEGTNQSVTVTDVYRYEGEEGTNVIVRATVRGSVTEPDTSEEPTFQFRGTELRIGEPFSLRTSEYNVEGQLTQIQRSGESLPTQQTEFTMEATVSPSTADEIDVGDEYQVGGVTLAEITAVQRFPASTNGSRMLLVGVSARTIDQGGIEFDGSPLRVGTTAPFRGASYEITGEVSRRGTSDIETARRPFVVETDVPARVAEDITVGDEYRLGDESLVRIESTSFYTTEEPDRRRGILGVSVATREDDGTVMFGDRELRLNRSIPIRTGEYDITGEIVRRDTLEQAGEPETISATLELRNVRPELAAGITVGATERIDETTAEITSKTTRPAELVLESESGNIFLREHPRNLDVELGAQVRVRRLQDGTLRFRGQSLRTGETIPLELGQLRITAEITAIDG
jgi:hypothetical protein